MSRRAESSHNWPISFQFLLQWIALVKNKDVSNYHAPITQLNYLHTYSWGHCPHIATCTLFTTSNWDYKFGIICSDSAHVPPGKCQGVLHLVGYTGAAAWLLHMKSRAHTGSSPLPIYLSFSLHFDNPASWEQTAFQLSCPFGDKVKWYSYNVAHRAKISTVLITSNWFHFSHFLYIYIPYTNMLSDSVHDQRCGHGCWGNPARPRLNTIMWRYRLTVWQSAFITKRVKPIINFPIVMYISTTPQVKADILSRSSWVSCPYNITKLYP